MSSDFLISKFNKYIYSHFSFLIAYKRTNVSLTVSDSSVYIEASASWNNFSNYRIAGDNYKIRHGSQLNRNGNSHRTDNSLTLLRVVLRFSM